MAHCRGQWSTVTTEQDIYSCLVAKRNAVAVQDRNEALSVFFDRKHVVNRVSPYPFMLISVSGPLSRSGVIWTACCCFSQFLPPPRGQPELHEPGTNKLTRFLPLGCFGIIIDFSRQKSPTHPSRAQSQLPRRSAMESIKHIEGTSHEETLDNDVNGHTASAAALEDVPQPTLHAKTLLIVAVRLSLPLPPSLCFEVTV
jgi:hypothetical protein